jgi:phage I-like protein
MPSPLRMERRSFALPAWGTADAPPREFRIFEYGANFGTHMGQAPRAVWLSPENARAIVAEWNRRQIDGAGDYEHAVIKPGDDDGKPASAWFRLEARADGLWAVNVRWTPRARRYFKDEEYRYFSPLFGTRLDVQGRAQVVELTNFALTNWPVSDNQRPLIALAQAWARSTSMNPEQLVKMIVEILTAGGMEAEAAEAAANKIALQVVAGAPAPEAPAEPAPQTPAAAGMDPEAQAIVAAARSATGQTSPGAITGALLAMGTASQQARALSTRVAELERDVRDRLINDAVADGRLTPAQKTWAQGQTTETLKGYLAVAVPQGPGAARIEPPAPSAATPEARSATAGGGLAKEEQEVTRQLGLKPEAFSKAKPRN